MLYFFHLGSGRSFLFDCSRHPRIWLVDATLDKLFLFRRGATYSRFWKMNDEAKDKVRACIEFTLAHAELSAQEYRELQKIRQLYFS